MKCPECVEAGIKSRVYPRGGAVTAMIIDTYYDEEGKYHCHDPNHRSGNYDCNQGHSFVRITRNVCPTCGDWDSDIRKDI